MDGKFAVLGSRNLFLFSLPLPFSIPYSVCDANPKSLLYFYSKCESAETDVQIEYESKKKKSERDVELNASSYPQSLTALKPFHNFLFPFLSELGYIQSTRECIYWHAQFICICCEPLQK